MISHQQPKHAWYTAKPWSSRQTGFNLWYTMLATFGIMLMARSACRITSCGHIERASAGQAASIRNDSRRLRFAREPADPIVKFTSHTDATCSATFLLCAAHPAVLFVWHPLSRHMMNPCEAVDPGPCRGSAHQWAIRRRVTVSSARTLEGLSCLE